MLPNPDEKLDPRVRRTRGLILSSFESLLAEKNFEGISVQDVTEKAQINRATFYAHFQTGEAGDVMDYFEWTGLYELKQDLLEKIHRLETTQ